MSFQVGALKFSFVADAGRLMDALNKASESVSRFMGQVKRAANDFAQFTGMMSAGVFAATSLAATIDQRALNSINNLKDAGGLLAVQVSDVVKPGIDALTRALEEMSRFVAGMSPELKSAVSAMAEWGVQAALVSKIVGSIAGFAGAAIQALTGIATAIGGISVVGLVTVFGWLAAIAVGVAALHAAWRTNFLRIRDVVAKFGDAFVMVFGGIFRFASDAFRAFNSQMMNVVNVALTAAEALADVWYKGAIPEKVLKGFATARTKIAEFGKMDLSTAITSSFETIKDAAATAGELAADAFTSEWAHIAEELGLDRIAAKVKGIFASTGAAPRAPGGVEHVDVGTIKSNAGEAPEFVEKLTEIQRESAKKMEDYHSNANRAHFSSLKQEWDRAAGEMKAQTSYFVNLATSTMGEAGQAVSNIIQGAQAGGIWGAIIAAIAELLKRAESFQRFIAFLGEGLNRLGGFLDQIIKPFMDFLSNTTAFHTESFAPIFEALGELFTTVGEILEPFMASFVQFGNIIKVVMLVLKPIINVFKAIIQIVGAVLGAIFKVLYDIGNGILRFIVGIMDAVIDIWNALLTAVADVVAFVVNLFTAGQGGAGVKADMMKAAGNHEGTKKMLAELENASLENAKAQVAASGAAWDAKLANDANSEAVDKSTQAAQRAYEALTNIPSGFKVALARFNATEAELGAKAETAVKYATGEGAVTLKKAVDPSTTLYATAEQREAANNYRIEQMNIYAKSEGFSTLEAMKREARKERARDRGNPYGKGEGGGY